MEAVAVREVTSGQEDDAFVLAFALEDGQALIFQLAISFDQQDAMLGMDTYSISSASGATAYGGLASAQLDGSLIVLQLDDEPAATLGLSNELRLRLADVASVEKAKDGLRRLGIRIRGV